MVRDPIDRMLSEFKMLWGRHNIAGINDSAVAAGWIAKQLRPWHDFAVMGDCHFLPQVPTDQAHTLNSYTVVWYSFNFLTHGHARSLARLKLSFVSLTRALRVSCFRVPRAGRLHLGPERQPHVRPHAVLRASLRRF